MPAKTQPLREMIARARAAAGNVLSEHDAKRSLATYGIPIVQEELAEDAASAVAAAERLGYPVVVKACAPSLAHKSDRGLVFLNAGDARAVEAAASAIAQAARGTPLQGYLIQRMVQGKREVIVGGARDPLFGPCVMLGVGGILVEAVGDVAFRLAPVDERDALEMMAELRARRIFDAFRGEPPVNRKTLAKTLSAVGQVLLDHAEIAQVDINPLIIEGAEPVAVDALITLREQRMP